VSYVLSDDQQDFLQDGGVSKSFTHKVAALEICLQDGGTSERLTHKMAAWEFCLQDGGNAAFLRVLPTRWRRGSFAYKTAATNKT